MAAQQEFTTMTEFKKPELALRQPGPMDLIQLALSNNAAIDVIERLAALQRESQDRDAKIAFNEALNRVQLAIKRVVPELDNTQTRSKYASYAAIDRVIRPVYSAEGISLSFTHADCPKPEHVRVICRVALGSHVELYQIDMPADGKGAKGGDVMTKTHATAAADSYAKRYLVKDIFNIAVGEDDDDGNLTMGWVANEVKAIESAKTMQGLKESYFASFNEAKEQKAGRAMLVLTEAYERRKGELQ